MTHLYYLYIFESFKTLLMTVTENRCEFSTCKFRSVVTFNFLTYVHNKNGFTALPLPRVLHLKKTHYGTVQELPLVWVMYCISQPALAVEVQIHISNIDVGSKTHCEWTTEFDVCSPPALIYLSLSLSSLCFSCSTHVGQNPQHSWVITDLFFNVMVGSWKTSWVI